MAAATVSGQSVPQQADTTAITRIIDGSRMFFAGGLAGATARTATAPLDRIKLLFQVQAVASSGTSATAYTGVGQPQLAANDQYKRFVVDPTTGELTVPRRLIAGACAGMTATALTHPLDTVRLRLALPNSGYNGMAHAMTTMVRTEGVMSLYKGLIPTLIGVAPYAAINFASYDMLKRRRMQMKGNTYRNQLHALSTIWATEGFRGFYRGWAANTLKVVPQNAIRFVSYETLKSLFGVKKAKTDT
eukprot:jgi/Picre1/29219/NNA_004611.t1